MPKDTLILITGGSSGIGKATAKILFEKGARIIVQARDENKLRSASLEIDPSGKRVHTISTDLSNLEAVQSAANQIVDEYGIPDVVINCAGAGEFLSLRESTPQHFIDTINSPYIATALTCKVYYDKMLPRGSGHFIIVNSVASYVPIAGAVGYSAARAAMLGFSRSFQADVHYSNFDVSLIAMGKVSSPYFSNNPTSEDRIPKIVDWLVPTLSEEQAGKKVAQLVTSKKKAVIAPFMMSVLIHFNRFFPGLIRSLVRMTGYKEPIA